MPDVRDLDLLGATPEKEIMRALQWVELPFAGTAAAKRKRLRDALEIPADQMLKLRFKVGSLSRAQLLRALQLRGLSSLGNLTEQRRRLAADVRERPDVEKPPTTTRAIAAGRVDLFGANPDTSVGAIRDTLLRGGIRPADDETGR